ncbi:MAG: hypothetical protein ACJA04_000869, partial [Cellvibrionaceae bacterium]
QISRDKLHEDSISNGKVLITLTKKLCNLARKFYESMPKLLRKINR